MTCLSCRMGLSLPGNQKPSQQTIFAEGKRYAGRWGRRPNERTVCSLRHHGLLPSWEARLYLKSEHSGE